MTTFSNIFPCCMRIKSILRDFRKFNTFSALLQQRVHPYISNLEVNSSLWFTNLPSRKRRCISLAYKRKSKKKKQLPTGRLVIECKNSTLNHYSNFQYGKFDTIPLASAGWYHKKSKGDYFTILPTLEHPAFLASNSEGISTTFEGTGLSTTVVEQLKLMKAIHPTTIQAKSIPEILKGENVIIAAETGCGKTLAYLAPIVENILKLKQLLPERVNTPLGVILLPSRELAIQVGLVAHEICSGLGIKCLTLVGIKTKKMILEPSVEVTDILISTLGIFKKVIMHNLYDLKNCKHLVIDEADTLLDDSFNQDLRQCILKAKLNFNNRSLPPALYLNETQLSLVSATLPRNIDTILHNILLPENLVEITTNYLHKIQPHLPQKFLRVGKINKPGVLLDIVKKSIKQRTPTIIFSNKTKTCHWINLFLNENGVKCIRLNSEMKAEERLQEYMKFKLGEVDIISCTDLASRGLDCTRVKHVINYEFPRFIADYIHRCGRTGRLGHVKGCFITNFVSSAKEVPLLNEIEKTARMSKKLDNVNNNITRILQRKNMNYYQKFENIKKRKGRYLTGK